MDDLKLYGNKDKDINSLINTVKAFTDDIKMKFGYAKCGRIIINRGKVKRTDGIEIDTLRRFKTLVMTDINILASHRRK